MSCPKCNHKELVRDGIVGGRQRYLCKSCRYRHTVQERGKSSILKRQALELYLEGLGFRSIGRFLKVSNVSVLNWIRRYGKELEELRQEKSETIETMEMDELHSYIGSKKTIAGCGWLLIELGSESSRSSWVVVGQGQGSSFGKRSKDLNPNK